MEMMLTPLLGAATAASVASTAGTILPWVAGGLQVGGMVEQAGAARAAGEAQRNEANYEAAQLRENADEQQAAAEQRMQQDNLKTAYVISNARAAAAGGGGSATDPTVETNLQTIAGQGRYRALTDMYQGNAMANQMNAEAIAKQNSGNISAEAGRTRAYSTILGGAGSLFTRYANVSTPGSPSGGGNSNVMSQDEFDAMMNNLG